MKSFHQIMGIIATFWLITSTVSYAGDHHSEKHSHLQDTHSKEGHAENKHSSPVEALSPKLRDLLAKEMQALQQGMMEIIPAYAAGDWEAIEDISYKMEHSYILKQNLTNEQVQELHHLLPESFLRLDQEFHYLAGMLNHAAKVEKSELVGFYFSELSHSCINCHSQHATHKFPKLKKEVASTHHSH